MLKLISVRKKNGLKFFGSRNAHTDKINHYAERINKSIRNKDWAKADEYLQKLTALHDHLFKNAKASPHEVDWFQQNPLYQVKKHIQRSQALSRVSSDSKLPEIYKTFTSKNALQQSLETFLSTMKKPLDYQLCNIGGDNNQVVKVKLDENSFFVCRYFRVIKGEKEKECSSIDAVSKLTDVEAVVQPDAMILVEDCNDYDEEQVYLEFSEYFNRGNLEEYFKNLHHEEKDRSYIQKQCLDYTHQILNFYQDISGKGVWYTDLKPSNILLTQDDKIKISDAKGFVRSDTAYTAINRCSVSANYHDSSCYENDRDLNLFATQQKTLAATIYQLLVNEVPEFIGDTMEWGLEFDFNKTMFNNESGQQLQELIQDLYEAKFHSIDEILDRLDMENQPSIAASSSQSMSALLQR